MEWQQKAGRAFKAWGRSHWCCFRQKLFHVYARVRVWLSHSTDILCGDLSYNSSHEILLPSMRRGFAHLAALAAFAPEHVTAGRLRRWGRLWISPWCVGRVGLKLWRVVFEGCSKKGKKQSHVSERYREGPLSFNIQPINLTKGRLLSCVKRKGGEANSWWCAAEMRRARRQPSHSPKPNSLTKRQKQENQNDTTRDRTGKHTW